MALVAGLVVALVGACDENFNDIYAEPVGGAAGMSGGSGQSGSGGGGAAGASCEPVCKGLEAIACSEKGEPVSRGTCAIGCVKGECASVQQLAAGDGHTCVLLSSGEVRCWGDNDHGQLGIDSEDGSRARPTAVAGLSGVKAIAASARNTCALDARGDVWCWGDNTWFQTGTAEGEVGAKPRKVVLGKAADEVAVGASQACARVGGTQVFCWGRGQAGQLGNGMSGGGFQTPAPASVKGAEGPSAIAQLALGGERSCARYLDGTLSCWGAPLASGDVLPGAAEAKAVPALAQPADQVAMGAEHLCVVTRASIVLCAGANDQGQLGKGDTAQSASFEGVIKSDDVSAAGVDEISLGQRFGCLRMGDEVQCWGANPRGQLGAGSGDSPKARAVSALGPVVSVVAGGEHACAISAQRQGVQCWGANGSGQLGNGSTAVSSEVVSVVW